MIETKGFPQIHCFYSGAVPVTIRVFAMLAGLYYLGHHMNTGKTLFAQVMEHVPWKTFGRIIERHNGDERDVIVWRAGDYIVLKRCT